MKDADPPGEGAKPARIGLRLIPWLAMAAMAALWRRRPAAAPAGPAGPRAPEDFAAAEPGRGRDAATPWAIPALGWKDIAWRTWRESGRDRLPALAGGVTFYLLLAAFPAIAAFVSIYGMFLDVDSVEGQLVKLALVLPRDAVSLIGDQMLRLARQRNATLSAAFAVSVLASAWSANAGIKALCDGLNIAYGETEKRTYLQRSLTTYGATLGAVLFLAWITGLTVAAPVFFHALGIHGLRVWWAPIRWALVWLLAAGAFTLLYRYGPSRRPARWRWVMPGAGAVAALWLVGSLGFTWYVNHFTHFGVTYGSLGAMIAFMLWIWVSVMLVLIGAEFNAEIEHQTACDTTAGAPLPLGERRAAMADSVGPAFTVSPREARHWLRDFLKRQVGYVVGFFRRLAGA